MTVLSPPQFFRALGDRTRLRIVSLLVGGPLCVCDIQFVLAQPQSSVSRHLALLRMLGLVRDRRDGMRTFYELTDWEAGLPLGVLEVLRRELETVREYQRDLDTLAAMKAAGACHLEGSDQPPWPAQKRRALRTRSATRGARAKGSRSHGTTAVKLRRPR